jgi:hypothetical protein
MQDKRELIASFEAEHRELRARVRELHKQPARTSAEQVEYEQLKTMEMAAAQRLRELTAN